MQYRGIAAEGGDWQGMRARPLPSLSVTAQSSLFLLRPRESHILAPFPQFLSVSPPNEISHTTLGIVCEFRSELSCSCVLLRKYIPMHFSHIPDNSRFLNFGNLLVSTRTFSKGEIPALVQICRDGKTVSGQTDRKVVTDGRIRLQYKIAVCFRFPPSWEFEIANFFAVLFLKLKRQDLM